MAMACLSMGLGVGGGGVGSGGTGGPTQHHQVGNSMVFLPSRISSPFISVSSSSERTSGLDDDAMAVAFPAAANANVMWFGKPTNASIVVNEGESPESIVRRFRREVMSAGVIAECRRRRFFETPQDVKKRKEQILRRRKINRKLRIAGGGYRPPPDPFAPRSRATKKEKDDDDEFWGSDSEEILFK